MDRVGDLAYVIIDTRDPAISVAFWSKMLGLPVSKTDEPFTDLTVAAGSNVTIGIQQVDHWQEGHSGIHIDINVSDLDVAIAHVQDLGGHLIEIRGDKERWAVMVDPAGNTFCLVTS